MGRYGYGIPSSERVAERAAERFVEEMAEVKAVRQGYFAPDYPGSHLMVGEGAICLRIGEFHDTKETFLEAVKGILNRRYYQPETIRKYMYHVRNFVNWLTIPLNRVTPKCIETYINMRVIGGQGVAGHYMCISALRTVFGNICGLEITDSLKLPVKTASTAAFSDLELQVMSCQLTSNRDRLLFASLLACDCTVAALLTIRKKDVVLKRGLVCIWKGLGRGEGWLKIPDSLLLLVKKCLAPLKSDDYLFSAECCTQKPICRRAVNKMLKERMSELQLPLAVNCRTLRRSGKVLSIESKDTLFTELCEAVKWKRVQPPAEKQKQLPVGNGVLKLELSDFEQNREVVTAKGRIVVKTDPDRPIHFRKISVYKHFLTEEPVVELPGGFKWETELKWLPRAAAEKLQSREFRQTISCCFQKLFVKRRSEISYIPASRKQLKTCSGW